MAKQTSLFLTKGIKIAQANIGLTATTIYPPSGTLSEDVVIKSLLCINTSANSVTLTVQIGTTAIGAVSIPGNAGFNGSIINVDVLNVSSIAGLPIDRNGKRILPLSIGTKITASAGTTGVLSVTAIIEEY